MLKIKLKDKVKILSGKDKGREGIVEKVFPQTAEVLVNGVNLYKKHIKGGYGQKSGIYDIPKPIDISRVALVCPKCSRAVRVGFLVKEDGSKVRVCKKCKSEID